jgi:hypothetical protein
MTRIAPAAVALGLTVLLAGCGRQGDLARPGPMWGSGAGVPPQTATGPASGADPDGDAAEGARSDDEESQGTGTRVTTPVDPNRAMRPATQQPIEGVNDPIGDRPPVEPR